MKKLFLAAVVAASLTGCASVPMGDPQRDATLKTFKVAADKAGIYIYRNETMGAAARMDVSVDGQLVGQTAANTYLYKEVAPGKHSVVSSAENTDTLDVEVQQGTLAYIWQEVKMGLMSPRTKLHLASEAEGKKGVQETSLAVSK